MNFIWFTYFEEPLFLMNFYVLTLQNLRWQMPTRFRRPWISFILQNVETPKPVLQTTPNSSSLSWLKDI